jgi:protein O-GlcNAc transferase
VSIDVSLASTVAFAENSRNPRQAAGLSRTVRAGFAHHQAGRLARAEILYRKALAKDPDHADALHLLGVVALQCGKIAPALDLIQRALPALSELPDAHLNYANALLAAGRLAEAVESYRRAIALSPDYGMAYSNLARVLIWQGAFEAGLESAGRAVELIPGFVGAQLSYAVALLRLERHAEAEAHLRRALALTPDVADLHLELGNALQAQDRVEEAEASHRRALALRPGYAEAHYNLGIAVEARGRLDEALANYRQAIHLKPGGPALPAWFRQKQQICDWSGYSEAEARVRHAIARRPSHSTAFGLLALNSTPAEQLAYTRRVAAEFAVPASAMLPRRHARPGERIRLGYLSADFRRHPVGHLIAELIERHERRDFEVVGYSSGPDDGSEARARLKGAFDRFVDITMIPYRDAARLIHADAIDILVDCNGFTRGARTRIFACRPAPIQVNYLGYPGTMGADFIDYIIVDRFVAPPDQQPFYTERLVHLPNCYQPSDTTREIAEPAPSRVECGLPEAGFVFCCFNNSYKITPDFFDIWMRLLHAVPGSVLWLVESNALVKDNLRREAASRGVAAGRLVFALPVPLPEYLARLGLADLFLDTLPYNAGATANDALWAGLPVLTCSGATYAGRMAGALLTAIGLPELITTSLAEYEALALRLATEPGRLAALRQRLARNRSAMPLFDTARFTRHLEAAYRGMWERWRAGQPPAAFSVSALAKDRQQISPRHLDHGIAGR